MSVSCGQGSKGRSAAGRAVGVNCGAAGRSSRSQLAAGGSSKSQLAAGRAVRVYCNSSTVPAMGYSGGSILLAMGSCFRE